MKALQALQSVPVKFEEVDGAIKGFAYETELYDADAGDLLIGTIDVDVNEPIVPSDGDYLIDLDGRPMVIDRITVNVDDRTMNAYIRYADEDELILPTSFDLDHEEER